MNSTLPPWRSVLAVVAHPDDESFGLGALLSTFAEQGSTVSVLCLTRGEASTQHGVDGDLSHIREGELRAAADELGIRRVELRSHPDGGLNSVELGTLASDVSASLDTADADGVVVFDADGVTGHPDHRRATEAALVAAHAHGLPVLGWTVPADVAAGLNAEFGASFTGHDATDIDLVLTVDRTRQSKAVACHPSQAVPGSVLWRRLELTGDREYLRHQPTDPDLPPVHPVIRSQPRGRRHAREHPHDPQRVRVRAGLDVQRHPAGRNLAKRDDVEMTVFLMGDGVTAAMAGQKTPDGYYNSTGCLAP